MRWARRQPSAEAIAEKPKGQLHKLITKENALSFAVNVDPSKHDQTAANRISRIFKAHGWVRARNRVNGVRIWHYRPPLGEGTRHVTRACPTLGGRCHHLLVTGKPSIYAAVTSVTSVTSMIL